MEALQQDLEHENQVEIGSIQSEFKVQLEIELKRQAADMTFDHEEQLKQLENDYKEKLKQLHEEFDEKLRSVALKQDVEKDIKEIDESVSMETVSRLSSPPSAKDTSNEADSEIPQEVQTVDEDLTDSADKPVEEITVIDEVVRDSADKPVEEISDFDEVVRDLEAKDAHVDSEDSQSQASTVVEVSSKEGGDKQEKREDEILEEEDSAGGRCHQLISLLFILL